MSHEHDLAYSLGFRYSNEEQISTYLICPICSEPLSDPLTASQSCGHTFCSSCISVWLSKRKGCPTCRGSLKKDDLSAANRIVQGLLDELDVQCLSCDWTGKRDEWHMHHQSCANPKKEESYLDMDTQEPDIWACQEVGPLRGGRRPSTPTYPPYPASIKDSEIVLPKQRLAQWFKGLSAPVPDAPRTASPLVPREQLTESVKRAAHNLRRGSSANLLATPGGRIPVSNQHTEGAHIEGYIAEGLDSSAQGIGVAKVEFERRPDARAPCIVRWSDC